MQFKRKDRGVDEYITQVHASQNPMKNNVYSLCCLNSDFTGATLIQNVLVHDVYVKCLFDTGASANYINEDVLNSKFKVHSNRIKSTSISVKMGDSTQIQATGKIFLPITFSIAVLHEEFTIVKNLSCDMILGFPFCWKYNIIIDAETG